MTNLRILFRTFVSSQRLVQKIIMAKVKKLIPVLTIPCICVAVLAFLLLLPRPADNISDRTVLYDSISRIVSAYPGEIGVAVIINGRDTVTVNDESIYPMMSVFKVHQAIAICDEYLGQGIFLDSVVTIRRDELDSNTWSPMLREYNEPVFQLRIRDLLRYTLTASDNNASNLMFERMVGPATTDSLIATIIPRTSFHIKYTESEMAADHDKAYSNYTSPLGAALLMQRLFTDSLVRPDKQQFIKQTLGECVTGTDRIVAPLNGKKGVKVYHKTGSGYTNEDGVLVAHNDVAYIILPDGTYYTLAVFVKDFKGNESEASQVIARISAVVYEMIERKY